MSRYWAARPRRSLYWDSDVDAAQRPSRFGVGAIFYLGGVMDRLRHAFADQQTNLGPVVV